MTTIRVALRTFRKRPLFTGAVVAILALGIGTTTAVFKPLAAILDEDVARPRFHAVMLGLFAATGLLLAAVGIYGVMGP